MIRPVALALGLALGIGSTGPAIAAASPELQALIDGKNLPETAQTQRDRRLQQLLAEDGRIQTLKDKSRDPGQNSSNSERLLETLELRDLLDQQDARQAEINQLRRDGAVAAFGEDVQQALDERLRSGSGAPTQNDQDIDRAQDLATGLADAGRRVDEINKREAEASAKLQANDREIDELLEKEQFAIIAQVEADELGERIENLEKDRATAEAERQQAIARNDAEAAASAEKKIAVFDDTLETAREVQQARENGTLPSREELRRQQLDASSRADDLFDENQELQSELAQLEAERRKIAALQQELAQLVRKGVRLSRGRAPVPAAQVALERFIGGQAANGPVTDDPTAQPVPDNLGELLEEVAKNDPLNPNNRGVDGTAGNTDEALGLNNAGGGIQLFPCPAGSNRLPAGTLVSDLTICFST